MCGASAQHGDGDPDFIIRQDALSGLWGVVDGLGQVIWPAEFRSVLPAGEGLALGYKTGDPDGYILGTLQRAKRIGHADLWRTYREAILKSDIPDRQLMVRVLDMNPDPLKRQQELEGMELTYGRMGEVRQEVVRLLLGARR